MGNQNKRTTNSDQSNRVVRTGLFHCLTMLATATGCIMKRNRDRSTNAPPSKRLRRSKRKPKVHFNDYVQIHTIDPHTDYSEKERKAVWRSAKEITSHARRNYIEQKHEGEDWRNAPEECDMTYDFRYGIGFHPCWTKPRKPHHSGVILYGSDGEQASYNHKLLHHVQKYGVKAFVAEKTNPQACGPP